VENEKDLQIKCLRSYKGGEYTSREFEEFCEEHGIRRQYLVAITLQKNGLVERKNKTVQEIVTAMLDEA